MIPITEAERREVFLQTIGNDHPLMDLIHRCINNDPQLRPHASEIIGQLAEMVLQFPASFANQLEMLRHVELQEEEKRALREEGERKDRVIQQNENQILNYREEAQAKDQQKAVEIEQLKIVHSSEVEQLRSQIRDLTAQNQLLNDEKEAEVAELKSKAMLYETQIENDAMIMLQEREQFDTQRDKEREQLEIQLEESETQQGREVSRKLLSEVRSRIDSLQHTNSTLEGGAALKVGNKDAAITRNESELESKTRVLLEKDAIISEMSGQLIRTRECLVTKQQVSSELFKLVN